VTAGGKGGMSASSGKEYRAGLRKLTLIEGPSGCAGQVVLNIERRTVSTAYDFTINLGLMDSDLL
jgi:hypothetical protein